MTRWHIQSKEQRVENVFDIPHTVSIQIRNVFDWLNDLDVQFLFSPDWSQPVQNLESIQCEVGVLPGCPSEWEGVGDEYQLSLVEVVGKDVPEAADIEIDVIFGRVAINELEDGFEYFFEKS